MGTNGPSDSDGWIDLVAFANFIPNAAGHVKTAETGLIDPVCGMRVDVNAMFQSVHEGRLYRFCSGRCRDTFEKDHSGRHPI